MRDLRRRSILAGALAVPLTAGLPTSSATAHSACAPDGKALRAALAGLPDADATAALVRVGGTGGDWRGSSGVHDLVSGRPADPGARFRAGSTTKVVTAAAVLRLVAEGRIDLNTPVQRYLPGLLGSRFRPVTVRHLLNHTSGIPAGDGLGTTFEEVYAHRFDTLTPQRVAASAGAKQPEFCPGKQQHYLNINYTFLGLLIERVTGRPYAAEAARLVLAPAGMRDTYFPGTDPRIIGPHNRGYQAVRRADGTTEFVDVTEWNQADRFAAGDMISTTADLERLLTCLFRGRIVERPQLKEVFSVPSGITGASYSAGGLQRFESDGKVYWVKSGGRYGYNSAIAATRDLSRTVVYSVNSTDAKSEDANPVIVRIITAALK
ncbi:CubicO group peptidase (beta-lactamase class C family) [Streptomyces sp. SAI-144]|uniref:serine hydrolase domain-containing protein n=1 Tax=unclassified Streptomyces TaxID=2593676 RepID=UPI002473520D|nr:MULTISPECIES: serine hydrolase domain-containing protein [unclassified Streptomyces]MDH6439693.1 CubicO group peptidase (beta-lactamase class C family) [Streptomyces sp. SAI-144]MDH6486982.1 CubicO group peptidase (beta-lactamase class C family) [Streptomyces sp. SAI-127]